MRRKGLAETIKEGNDSPGGWNGEKLRVLQLLKDVETRWSSTFLMIDRMLELYPVRTHPAIHLVKLYTKHHCFHQAIHVFLNKFVNREIGQLALDPKEQQILADIRYFLQVPHAVQELLSAEKTPTLSMAMPAYEKLIAVLRSLQAKLPGVSHSIAAAVRKLEEYTAKSRKCRLYAMAMGKLYFTNPYSSSLILC